MADLIVTIDGPAGSGKSTVARLLAKKLDADFLDTGAMYRAVALAAIEKNLDLADQDKLLDMMKHTDFTFAPAKDGMSVAINQKNVTEQIRHPDVTAKARYVANAPKLRAKLVEMQRRCAQKSRRIVTEGRDQGTVAFPHAGAKFFITANISERAKRRQLQLRQNKITQDLNQIQQAIQKRDKSDENRNVGPLKPAPDAITIDTTDLSIDQVIQTLMAYIEKNV